MVADHAFRGNRITSVERRHQKRLGSDHVRSSKASSSPCRHGRSAARADTLSRWRAMRLDRRASQPEWHIQHEQIAVPV